MLKFSYWVRRRPELTREEFDRYWFEQHAPLVRAHREALGIKRYIQTIALPDQEAQQRLRASRGAEAFDYDGCTEVWFESMEAHLAARKTPAGMLAAQLLIEDERRFIDLGRSQLWYGTERPIIED
ncbi:MAG TPA: EthD domain-containing protein [Kiloniellales bacterium]|nr:EthD domain-containing protein [Kiloniellales bacterium]